MHRTIVAATLVTSAAVYGGFLSPHRIIFYTPWIYKKFPPEIWRLITSFWLTGPQLGIILDPFLLWTYGSNLERDSPRFLRKGDFFVYVAFVQLIILVSARPSLHLVPVLVIYALKTSKYLLAQPSLAAAIPGIEEDYPCTVHIPIIRSLSKGLCGV